MKNNSFTLTTVAVICLVVFCGCRKENTSKAEFERLPELPQDIAATLDPNTLATKTPASDPSPVKQTGTAVAPCCDTTARKTLKVRYLYTKCGPLRDFIIAPLSNNLLSRQGGTDQSANFADVRVFKLTTLNGRTILDQQVCVTSQGPWNASFTESRACSPYTPQDTLIINAFGDLVQFVWWGGTVNHPPSVKLVSCRTVDTSSFECGGISDCECVSTSCPASEPCDCTLEGW